MEIYAIYNCIEMRLLFFFFFPSFVFGMPTNTHTEADVAPFEAWKGAWFVLEVTWCDCDRPVR